ncbi:VWA domain-containing protein [Phycicoccus sp. CSK15P-2]|uniref:vWA domain-containing protein n=1 Tax=Phycicoccus sp. CSK15P-2 TaxID=2807627 RepID=UPI0019518EB0|nr:VWA domain-containing protein [Phycicoccus sp. CSK15P-2]MBM6403550.1 VWA domain-containing protein [Phycicoccus sp. CSK15P-2]
MSLLAGADRAAFVTGLGSRLRAAGVPVDLTSTVAFTAALDVGFPRDVESLYWAARVTLVHRHEHHPTFDAVFDAVFRDTVLATDPQARRAARGGDTSSTGDTWARAAGRPAGDVEGDGLPWATLPRVTAGGSSDDEDDVTLPEPLPSAAAALADTPLEELDDARLAVLESWLQRTVDRWPTRRSRRRRPHKQGTHVALRDTLAASRRTGWETTRLRYRRPERRPRPVTVLVDVSRSMQPYAVAYLHLLRVLARTGRCETFVFSTELTRLTPALVHHSAQEARERAEAATADRFGGTHLAGSLRALRRSRWGDGLRGGVLVLASDGWDSDPPEELAAELARLRRRAHRILWLNPRAAAPGFEPRVGSMAAALPYCDAFLPAHSPDALVDVVAALVDD